MKRDEEKKSGSPGQLRNKPGDLELEGIRGTVIPDKNLSDELR